MPIIKDRLGELRAKSLMQRRKSSSASSRKKSSKSYLEMEQTYEFMKLYFEDVEDIFSNINEIESNIGEIIDIHNSILSYNETDNELSRKLEDLCDSIGKKGHKLRRKIEALRRQFSDANFQGTLNEYRMCQIQYLALTNKFSECMSRFRTIQQDFEFKCEARLKRQLEIVGIDETFIDLDELAERNTAIFTQQMLAQTATAEQVLRDIEQRHTMLLDTEKSIRQLNALFLDMAILIQTEGEVLDRIDLYTKNAAMYVAAGKKNIVMSKKLSDRPKKHLFCIIVVVCVFLVILLLALAVAYRPGSKK